MLPYKEKKHYQKLSPDNPTPYDVWEWIIDQPSLSNAQVRLLTIYAKHINLKTFECHPSRGLISDLTGWREHNVSRTKTQLEILGYLTTIGRGKYQKIKLHYGFKRHHMTDAEILNFDRQQAKKQSHEDTKSKPKSKKQSHEDTEKGITERTPNYHGNSHGYGSSTNPSGNDHQEQLNTDQAGDSANAPSAADQELPKKAERTGLSEMPDYVREKLKRELFDGKSFGSKKDVANG